MIDACAKAGDLARAEHWLETMLAKGVRPNVVAYASLARPFAHHGDWAEVERIRRDMQANGLAMNEYFLYALLLAYASAKPREAKRAETAFLEAIADGVPANKHVL